MGTGAITVLAALVAVVGVAAVAWWSRRRPGPVELWTVAVGLVAVGAASFLAFVGIAVKTSRWAFPVAHLAYLVAAGAVPAVALATLVAMAWRRSRWTTALVALALLVPAPVGWYASHVAPYRLRVDRVEVELPEERAGSQPVRVGVLADLQATRITSYERRAVTTLLAEEPDLIVVPGDLFQGTDAQFEEHLEAFRALLARLEAPGGVYAVRGDTDTDDRMDQLLDGTGIEILDNEIVTIEVGDRTVQLGGNPLRWAPLPALEVRQELGAADPEDLRILVAHRPEVIFGLGPEVDVDVTIAGHTHGGQVAIPGYGPIVTYTSVPRAAAAGGLHEVDGHRLYVSSGVGMVRLQAPQIRLFTRPSVGIITLR